MYVGTFEVVPISWLVLGGDEVVALAAYAALSNINTDFTTKFIHHLKFV